MMPEDHDHFLRIFPEARALPWTHFPEEGYWRVEFDPDNPTPAESAALGETRPVCLERLRRIGFTAPPAPENEADGSAEAPGMGERPPKKPPLVRPFLLLLFILVLVGGGVVVFFSSDPPPPGIARPPSPDARPATADVPAAEPGPAGKGTLEGDVIQMLDHCRRLLENGDLTTGEAGDALSCYRRVLARVPDNVEALTGLRRIERHFIARVESTLKRGHPDDARRFLATLAEVNPDSVHLARLREELRRREESIAPAAEPPAPPLERRTPPASPRASPPMAAPAADAPSPDPADSPSPASDRAGTPPSAPEDRPASGADDSGLDTDTLIRESLGAGFEPTE
jgi:hypothetical protein